MKHQSLDILPTIIQEINSALTLKGMLKTSLKRSLKAVNASEGAILLFNPSLGVKQFKEQIFISPWLESRSNQERRVYQCVVERVIESEQLINCPNMSVDSRWKVCFQQGGPRSLLCVPVAIDQRTLGVLIIGHVDSHYFHSEEEQFVSAIAKQIALAVEVQLLRKVSTELSTLPIEKILPKIVDAACFLSAARSSIVLLSESRDDEELRVAKFPITDERPYQPRARGLTYEVTTRCEPLIISDVQNNERVTEATKERGIVATLGIPLEVTQRQDGKDRIRAIGGLFVEIVKPRKFSQREQEVLQSLANQAAIAIENDRHTRALKRLNTASFEIVSSTQDILSLAETILAHAIKLVDADGGRLCLLNEDNTEVQFQTKMNFSGPPIDLDTDTRVGVFGHVVREKKSFTKSDYAHWPERRKSFDQFGFTAVVGVPILHQKQLWGVIVLHDTREGRAFSQQSIELLTNLANLAAVAFSNASRLDDLGRLIESAFACVIAVDNQGRITQFNRQAEQMLHYSREDVLGKPITELYYRENGAREVQKLLMDGKDGKFKEYYTELKSRKGQKIPIRLSASLLFDYEGKRSGSVGFFHDQRRNQARIAITSLLDREEIFNAIVTQAYEITGASHSTHLALNINNKLQVTVAYPPNELLKKRRIAIDVNKDPQIGISGRAFKAGAPQLVGDVTKDPDYIAHDSKTSSELSVPIKTQTAIIGVIDVQHSDKDAFNETDLRNLETLAQFAAIAMHNSELYEESQVDKKRFETVADIIRGAAQTFEVDQLLKSTCERLESIFTEKQGVASIRLYDREKDQLIFDPAWHETFHHQLEDKVEKVRTTQPLDEGICGHVARTQRSLNVGNVELEPTFYRLIAATQSELAVPIHLDEGHELIGVLDLQSPRRNAFTQNDLEFLEILARQLAIDIDKAQFAEREKKRAEAEEALRLAAAAAIDSAELKETLEQLTRQVYELAQARELKINSTILRLITGDQRILAAAQPPEILPRLRKDRVSITTKEGIDGKIGISGRAILDKETQSIGDVADASDYLLFNLDTQSELAIPIIMEEQVIALMDMEFTEKYAFDEEDKQVFEALASQAGIAIDRANRYKQLERRHRHQEAVYKASRIISRGVSAPKEELLFRILEQAVERIIPISGKKVSLGVLQLYDAEKNELRRECVYPKNAVNTIKGKLEETRTLERAPGYCIGINGRAVLDGKSQRVNNVLDDPDYFGLSTQTRSELDVVLLDENKNAIGVLGLESNEFDAFDREDELALRSLADLAVIAIRNAEQYQELEKTRGTLAARTIVAWLAADRTAWQHKIVGHIGAIENYITLLQREIKSDVPEEKLQERLTNIKELIALTRERKIAKPLAPEEGLEKLGVDQFISQWIASVKVDPELFPNISIDTDLKGQGAKMQVNKEWFKLALDNILNNALRAVANSPRQEITVRTSIVDEMVNIVITDTGPGIPPDLKSMMFTKIIPKKSGGRGEGIGQMLSRTIFETYGGAVDILSTDKTGTSIIVTMPCVNPGHQHTTNEKVLQL